jgi:hypothetical protein
MNKHIQFAIHVHLTHGQDDTLDQNWMNAKSMCISLQSYLSCIKRNNLSMDSPYFMVCNDTFNHQALKLKNVISNSKYGYPNHFKMT